ncbi:fibronectin type III domain-containing protein [Paenibacillus mucilaginosus]|uniref:fibronectin type III domain-containing protein n=1 Tax=Paenibacillus mucilaginosus TaxID=61624 RepID=UPI001EEFF68F|nr:fibronectin type III domain-containing protein [Paenibacillus mucilaginosus]MCG7218206.1 fibronectin type III domain-containing protein [Paenibacillus mucilaginosus]
MKDDRPRLLHLGRLMKLVLAVFVLALGMFPAAPSFAYQGGVLEGKLFGPTANFSAGVPANMTDNNLTTTANIWNGKYVEYEFPAAQNFEQMVFAGTNSGSMIIGLYDINGALITSLTTGQFGTTTGTLYTKAVVANGVKKVRITNNGGGPYQVNEIDAYGPAPDTIPPGKPTGLSAVAHSGSTDLSWTANPQLDGVTGYNVYKNGVKVNTSLITGTTYTVTSLTDNTTYYFKVTAVDAAGNESVPSDQVSSLYDTLSPLAPIGVTAVTGSAAGTVEISWTPNPQGEVPYSYNLYKDSVKYNSSPILHPTTTHTVVGINSNVNYIFAVTALDAEGNESGQSTPVTYYFDTVPPTKPAGVTAVGGDQKINLTWSANTESDIKGYNVWQGTTRLNTALLTSPSFEHSGLAPSTQYSYEVTALDQAGNESVRSNLVTATTTAAPDLTPPPVPTGLTGSPYDGAVILQWLGVSAPDLAGYNVYMDGVKINVVTLTSLSLKHTGLTNDTSYVFQVSAVDKAGNESALSPGVTVMPTTKSIPLMSVSYTLKDISDSVSSWFSSIWAPLAFSIAIPLSFFVARRVKGIFVG